MEEGNSTDPVNVENTNQTTGAEGGNEQAATAAPDTGAKQQDLESSLKDNFLNQAKESEAGDGEKPAEDDKEADKDKKEQPEGAPESYEDFKTPSGQQLDVQLSDSFKEAAKEANLSQSEAQALLDKMAPVLEKRNVEMLTRINNQWTERSRADKELSADWNRSMADIARFKDRFSVNADGSKDADIEELMSLPIGNHPGLLKLLARAGRAIGEGGFPTGSPEPKKYTPDDVYRSRS